MRIMVRRVFTFFSDIIFLQFYLIAKTSSEPRFAPQLMQRNRNNYLRSDDIKDSYRGNKGCKCRIYVHRMNEVSVCLIQ